MVNYVLVEMMSLTQHRFCSGYVWHEPRGRYCFQTTYMYDRLEQYQLFASDSKVVWLLRNPYSVVWSMLHNWKRSALAELFAGCGRQALPSGYASSPSGSGLGDWTRR